MKRKITAREWLLLGILAVILAASAYVMLFYLPVTSARDDALAEAETYQAQIETARLRVAEKRRMEQALEEIFAREETPLGLPDYDNLQPVMVELNTILAPARD